VIVRARLSPRLAFGSGLPDLRSGGAHFASRNCHRGSPPARLVRFANLILLALVLCGCASPPPRAISTGGWEIRTHQPLDEECHKFGRELRELDARLRSVYGVELPPGTVWIDPEAFKGQPIGGTYEWFSDRIVLADSDYTYLAHELVHRYNRYTFGELPRWLDEGLAYALARGGVEGLESTGRRRPDFEAIAEVREARFSSLRESPRDEPVSHFPTLAEVFDNPYENGHLHIRIATAIVDRLLRDRTSDLPLGGTIRDVVKGARDLTPEGARAVLERACFQDFPRDDELRELLADDSASDELILALTGPPDLDAASRAAASDPKARRRLALLIAQAHTPQGPRAERRYLERLLQDPDPRVARAAVFALACRDDHRMLGPLIEVLKDAPLFRYVRLLPGGGARFETVPLERTLARLAGVTAPGARIEGLDDTEPVPYRTIEAWERWYSLHAPPPDEQVDIPALANPR
jgi:hypothetical protein